MAKNTQATERRLARVRRSIKQAANGRPRLSVFRSSKQIYAQVIDDAAGVTLVAASTMEKDLRGSLKTGADIEAAKTVGKLIAERAKQAGVDQGRFRPRLLHVSRARQGARRCRPRGWSDF